MQRDSFGGMCSAFVRLSSAGSDENRGSAECGAGEILNRGRRKRGRGSDGETV